jgi:hypothetical protein
MSARHDRYGERVDDEPTLWDEPAPPGVGRVGQRRFSNSGTSLRRKSTISQDYIANTQDYIANICYKAASLRFSSYAPKRRRRMPPAKNAIGSAHSRASLDGAGLEKALAQGSLDRPATQLIGMMKASAEPGHVSFAPAGCGSWVDIPSAMIAEAQHIGHQPCEDHSHPVFRIVLNEPADPQAKVLLQLIAARTPAAMPMSMSMPAGLKGFGGEGLPVGPSISELRKPQCTSWCVGSTLMCACPVYIPGFGMGYVFYACGTCINDPVFTAFA